jgi:hypothetical protein
MIAGFNAVSFLERVPKHPTFGFIVVVSSTTNTLKNQAKLFEHTR